jgi:hypothetical protein
MAFETQPADTELGSLLRQPQGARPLDQPPQVGHLPLRLRAVTAVSAEHTVFVAVDMHQQGAVGAGESGEISNIQQIGDQQRLEAEFG